MRLAALLWMAVAAGAADEPRAFVEMEADALEVYVGQPVGLTLRIGYDAAFFEKQVVQMFQSRLDLPVHVEAEGWPPPRAEERGRSLAFNDDVRYAAESTARGGFTVVELRGTIEIDEPGERILAAPRMRYAWGTQFRDDFVHGRVAVDRRLVTVEGKPLTLRVLTVPEAGRPDTWRGAVGQFSIGATVEPTTIDEGGTIELKLALEGRGNMREIALPVAGDLGLEGFHVVGSLRAGTEAAPLFVYTLRPLDPATTAVPALAFAYFDPRPPARFRVARSEPVPITVRAKPRPEPAPKDVDAGQHGVPAWLIGGAIACIVALAVFVWRAKRTVEAGPSEAFVRFESDGADDLAEAFPAYLATQLDCPPAAVISPDLTTRLVAAGVPDALAARSAAMVEELVGARYGGAAIDAGTAGRARALVSELESVFHPAP